MSTRMDLDDENERVRANYDSAAYENIKIGFGTIPRSHKN